jgi:CheY-like chemotaxis protein
MPGSESPPGRRARILVIDDEPEMRETLEAVLASEGYQVDTAETGMVAIERAKTESFDLAIADLRMPGLSGIETIASLRRLHPNLAVVVVSGYVSEESTQRCLEEGVFRILVKPVHFEKLLQVVEDALLTVNH